MTTGLNDDDQYIWDSQADCHFTVTKDVHGEPLGKEIRSTLHIKEDLLEYME